MNDWRRGIKTILLNATSPIFVVAVLVFIITGILIVVGTVQNVSSPLASDAASRELLERLLTDKSPSSLATLLHANCKTVPGISRVGGSVRGFPESDCVYDAKRIECSGKSFIVAIAQIEGGCVDPPEQPRVGMHEAAFVFDSNGKLLGQIDGCENADSTQIRINVVTLGVRDRWFIWVEQKSPVDGFEVRSEIIEVEIGLPRLLVVLHQRRNVIYSNDRGQSIAGLITFIEPGTSPIRIALAGGNNNDCRPILQWESNSNKFSGPKEFKHQGSRYYEIDELHSPAFQAISCEPATDQQTGALNR